MEDNYVLWPFENLSPENVLVVDVSTWSETCAMVEILAADSLPIPTAEVPEPAEPAPTEPELVEPEAAPASQLISLDYKSSGDESDLWGACKRPCGDRSSHHSETANFDPSDAVSPSF